MREPIALVRNVASKANSSLPRTGYVAGSTPRPVTFPKRRHRLAKIDADELVEVALRRARRRNFKDWSFFEPLCRLVGSLNHEADLNSFGVKVARYDSGRCLTNLLRLEEAEERDPETARRAITRPIFITGFPRSATTFLHSLLAQNPGVAVPHCWELIYPYAPKGAARIADLRKPLASIQLSAFRFIAPKVHALHPLSAGGPQECTDITAHTFRSLRFDTMYRVPSYQNWLQKHGHYEAYEFHRRFLNQLGHESRACQWVVKSPDHMVALDAIRKAYPDAVFICLHRDPIEVLTSQLNLTEALRRPFARHVDLTEVGRGVSESIADLADRLVAVRSDPDVLHLTHRAVARDPAAVLEAIYSRFGLAMTRRAKKRAGHWLLKQRRVKPRHHHRSLGDYGLKASSVAERFLIYRDTFGEMLAEPPVAHLP